MFEPLPINTLEDLLFLERGRALYVLQGLYSVLNFPAEPDDKDKPITIYHESLRERLIDERRLKRSCIVIPEHHSVIVHRCLGLMTTNFSQGSCVLDHPESFSPILWYACDYWGLNLGVHLRPLSSITSKNLPPSHRFVG